MRCMEWHVEHSIEKVANLQGDKGDCRGWLKDLQYYVLHSGSIVIAQLSRVSADISDVLN